MAQIQAFDPYYKWLGISPRDQPPNFYRLLGLELFESDPDVIDAAAERQMTYLHSVASGEHTAASQKLMNEVSSARVSLLNEKQKAQYDRRLKSDLANSSSQRLTKHGVGDSPRSSQTGSARSSRPISTINKIVLAVAFCLVTTVIVLLFIRGGANDPDREENRQQIVAESNDQTPPVASQDSTPQGKPQTTDDVDRATLQNTAVNSTVKPDVSKPNPQENKSEDSPKPAIASDSGNPPKNLADEPAPSKPTSETLAIEGVTDLLARIDLERDSVQGSWSKDTDGLVWTPDENSESRLQLPAALPAEYDLTIHAERLEGNQGLMLGLVANGVQFLLVLDARHSIGIQQLDEKRFGQNEASFEGRIFSPNEMNKIVCRVCKTGLAIKVDGLKVLDWEGDFGRTELPSAWSVPNQDRLFIGGNSAHRISKLQIEPIANEQQQILVSGKLPVPNESDLLAAERVVLQWFKADFDSAKRPVAKLEFSKNLVARAREAGDDANVRFVLLQQARDLAAAAGDASHSLAAVDEICKQFSLDQQTLKFDAFEEAARSARTPSQASGVARVGLDWGVELVASNDFELATRVSGVTATAARRANDPPLAARAEYCDKRVDSLSREYKRINLSLKTLEQNPEDPEANQQVGIFYCLHKGDWERGLPLLSASNDATLKRIAQAELAKPTEPTKQAALGDDWWEFAGKQRRANVIPPRRRAKYWYTKAVEKITDRSKTTILKRMAIVPSTTAVLHLSLKLDGTDELIIAPHEFRWKHIRWQIPSVVYLNGVEWKPAQNGVLKNQGSTRILPDGIDVRAARLVKTKARGTVEMRLEGDHLIIKLADETVGASDYELSVIFGK